MTKFLISELWEEYELYNRLLLIFHSKKFLH